MKFTYLPSAQTGLDWFRLYYGQIFPEGRKNARDHYFKMKRALRAAPMLGKPIGENGDREYTIPRTPFSVIYRIRDNTIEVRLVIDQRAERPGVY